MKNLLCVCEVWAPRGRARGGRRGPVISELGAGSAVAARAVLGAGCTPQDSLEPCAFVFRGRWFDQRAGIVLVCGQVRVGAGRAGDRGRAGAGCEESVGGLWGEYGEFGFEGERGIEGSEGEVECGRSWTGHEYSARLLSSSL